MHNEYHSRPSRGWQYGLILLALAAFIGLNMRGVWGTSGDFAHHYALVARIWELFGLPIVSEKPLGEMNFYPPASHVLGAVAAHFLHSPLLGMHLVSLLALFALWVAVCFMLLSLPRKNGMLSTLLLPALTALCWWLDLVLHGRELTADFFYAQLVAQAMLMCVACSILWLERQHSRRLLLQLLTFGLAWACVYVHLLASLQLLAFATLLFMVDALQVWRSRQRALRRAAFTLLLAGLCAWAISRNYYFIGMQRISSNNGQLELTHLNSVGMIGAYAAAACGIAAFFLWQWLRLDDSRRKAMLLWKYWACYGMAIASLCLLQLLVLQFGQGSEYAVKKYIFSLHMVQLVNAILLLGWLAQCVAPRLMQDQAMRGGNWHHYLLPSAGVLLCLWLVMPLQKIYQMSDLYEAEQAVMNLRVSGVPYSPAKASYVTEIRQAPPMVNYMLSLGLLHSPRDDIAASILQQRPIRDFSAVNTLVTTADSQIDRSFPCRRNQVGGKYVVLDGRCIMQALRQSQGIYDFTDRLSIAECQIDGLSEIEAFGRWTERNHVRIRCPLPELPGGRKAERVELDITAFLEKTITQQRVQVSLNGAEPAEYVIDRNMPTRMLSFSLKNVSGSMVDFRLTLPDAKSPKELGLGDDPRILGVSVRQLAFK
ncbi:hypothetical protein V8J88_21770 [Massilia sp. W12]|uniref:DUF7024 domain-containing protein n=1 Tax=Massilia sp. W12 TaxID=3126507 RepID=UPI0030CE6A0E